MKCECGGDFNYMGTMSKEHTHHIVIECVKCNKAHNIFYFKDLAEEQEARAEKAEAEVARIMAILEKNPYPESVFTKVTGDEFVKIHKILQIEMNMPIDRLSGEYMRMTRKQIINEIKKAKE